MGVEAILEGELVAAGRSKAALVGDLVHQALPRLSARVLGLRAAAVGRTPRALLLLFPRRQVAMGAKLGASGRHRCVLALLLDPLFLPLCAVRSLSHHCWRPNWGLL
jgi:hypothetical protein